MAATYDPNISTDKDWVRLQIGDRAATFVLQNEEITFILAEEPNKWYAAAACGELIIGSRKGIAEKMVDNLRIEYGDDADSAYAQHLQRLREEGARRLSPAPYAFKML